MKDTTPEMEALVRARYRAMTPGERVAVGAQMFDTARAIVIASLPPGLSAGELRRRLCERLYGSLAQRAYASRRDGGVGSQ